MEAVALAAVLTLIATGPSVSAQDWMHAAVLAACATLHVTGSRWHEESRRHENGNLRVHIDLGGLWSVAALLVLPPALLVGVIVLIRWQRWPIARKPAWRYVFSTSAILLAAVSARAALNATGPHHWTALDLLDSTTQLLLVLGVGLIYNTVQAALIGAAFALEQARATARMMLGGRQDNAEAAIGTVGAVLVTVTLANAPAVVGVVSIGLVIVAAVLHTNEHLRHDVKTGVLNAAGWQGAAHRELHRARHNQTPTAVLIVDADQFKGINDRWGHLIGDVVLREIATALRTDTRPTDIVGRFGGEEFALLLPDTDTDSATQVAERVRTRIAHLRVPVTTRRGHTTVLTGRQAPPVAPRPDDTNTPPEADTRVISVSIGVAADTGPHLDLTRLLSDADAALYQAKAHGRNRVEVAHPAPAPQALATTP
ncbi:GGDEF domain-containing protein [Goodfellowiella coeruleoviolacea]|uniref:GGDEF domain-containing protein n=1 Tax=Goodfellowiella coeruleoviolacea TaxID=334858 RepID=UPI0020A37ADE|nr:diguanylate cyclase [Goodfellowiella coeruleoviolacea]